MNRPPPIAELARSEWGTMEPGTERVAEVLRLAGNPHLNYPHILVGGTNGKGSVSSYLASGMGPDCGLFLSPHIHDVRERITIDGSWLPDASWQSAHEYLLDRAKLAVERLSYFELILALAVVMFWQRGVKMAVFEVGLGGELDATNALNPMCSVLTNVELDHTAILGRTKTAIAWHKLGIGRVKKPMFIPSEITELPDVPRRIKEIGCKVIEHSLARNYDENIGLANQVLVYLGYPKLDQYLTSNLPGRRQFISLGKGIHLDGAHNEAAWRDLATWCGKHFSGDLVVVAGLSEGRDPRLFHDIFRPVCKQISFFQAGFERELQAECWGEIPDITEVQENNIAHLLQQPLLVCGSLYVLHPFMLWLQRCLESSR